jgi:single-stranded DNA-binding protein
MLTSRFYRTLVYVEGDASMRVYEDAEGKKQSSLNIVQRPSTHHPLSCR